MEMAFTLPFGQFDDLKDLPGLAHLTEHLLLSGPGPSDALQA
jgi:secreted Zn-dependent insulinase-like peptidase